MNSKTITIFLLLFTLIFTGCGANNEKQTDASVNSEPYTQEAANNETQTPGADIRLTPDGERLYDQAYSIMFNYGDYLYFDENGEYLSEGDMCTGLHDIITGELKYYEIMKLVKDGPSGEDESGHKRLFKLCDLNGNTIIDYSGNTYQCPIGNYIISREFIPWWEEQNGAALLINPVTSEIIAENVEYIMKLNEDTAFVRGTDYKLMGTLFADGSIKAGFPTEYKLEFPTKYKDYIYGECDGTGYILDENLSPVLSEKDIACMYNMEGLAGDYFTFRDRKSDINYVCSLSDNQKVFETTYELIYFDGNRAVTFDYKKPESTLTDVMTGEVLATYNFITKDKPSSYGNYEKADAFYAYDINCLYKLDYDGNVLLKVNAEQTDGVTVIGKYLTTYSNLGITRLFDENLNAFETENEIISAYALEDFNNPGNPPGIVCTYYTKHGQKRSDVYDNNGKLIAEGLRETGSCLDGKFIAWKGDDIGLMDMSGSWVNKHSFYELGLNTD